jgi:hypothetical protein
MKPLNNHLMIQPLETDSFMATQKTTYEEVGLVLALPNDFPEQHQLKLGAHVYFDSWLAKKFPVTGKTNEFVWFVKYEDVVAYESIS